jgi:hypothetical protein
MIHYATWKLFLCLISATIRFSDITSNFHTATMFVIFNIQNNASCKVFRYVYKLYLQNSKWLTLMVHYLLLIKLKLNTVESRLSDLDGTKGQSDNQKCWIIWKKISIQFITQFIILLNYEENTIKHQMKKISQTKIVFNMM